MLASELAEVLGRFDPASPRYATDVVERVLADARAVGASDVHFQPRQDGLELRWRIDGVLQPAALLPQKGAPNVVSRLKVLADLLTYRTDIPQEGRIRGAPGEREMRLSTFPTLFGERAVVRMFAESGRFLRLEDLGLPSEIGRALAEALQQTSGAIVLSGPAGSGKTTTIYACLRELTARSGGERSLVSMEDPIEAVVEGVAQAQVNPAAGLTLESGLKSLLRQDPEVIAIGEIRDKSTAEIALEAALTGHLILTTIHAGSACEAIGRLLDMGIEPYVVRSGLRAVVAQRLVRRLCECAQRASRPEDLLGLPVRRALLQGRCEACRGTGYSGRTVLAEMLFPEDDELARAVLERSDVRRLERIAVASGMIDLWQRACAAVEDGLTSPAEVRRVLGTAALPESSGTTRAARLTTDQSKTCSSREER
jgi:type II secretory ATPase GspE/PulE/Tfp pilus assembly ATPase PilB-like protein